MTYAVTIPATPVLRATVTVVAFVNVKVPYADACELPAEFALPAHRQTDFPVSTDVMVAVLLVCPPPSVIVPACSDFISPGLNSSTVYAHVIVPEPPPRRTISTFVAEVSRA